MNSTFFVTILEKGTERMVFEGRVSLRQPTAERKFQHLVLGSTEDCDVTLLGIEPVHAVVGRMGRSNVVVSAGGEVIARGRPISELERVDEMPFLVGPYEVVVGSFRVDEGA